MTTKTKTTLASIRKGKAQPIATPISSSALATKSMLVSLWTSKFGNRVTDDAENAKVAQRNKSDANMSHVTKSLIAKEALAEINRAASAAKTYHYERTLPWADTGYRILPSVEYFDYMAKQREFKRDFDAAVDALVDIYPRLVREAETPLGGLYNKRVYPTVAELRGRYAMHVSVTPLPNAADFRADIGDGELQRAREDIEARLQAAFVEATRDLWARLHKTIKASHDRIAAYGIDAKGNVEHAFRDSVIENIRDLCELLPRLNITEDAELDAMRLDLLGGLCKVDPQQLRNDDTLRQRVLDEAQEIMTSMAGYVPG
jgi:flagellar basal body rod protein FlgC